MPDPRARRPRSPIAHEPWPPREDPPYRVDEAVTDTLPRTPPAAPPPPWAAEDHGSHPDEGFADFDELADDRDFDGREFDQRPARVSSSVVLLVVGVLLAAGIIGAALVVGRDSTPTAGAQSEPPPTPAPVTGSDPAEHTVDVATAPPADAPTDTLTGAFPAIEAAGGCPDVADLTTDDLTVGDTTAAAAKFCVPDPAKDSRVVFLQWPTAGVAEQFRNLSDPATSTQRTWGWNGTTVGPEVNYVSGDGYTVQELHFPDSRYVALVMGRNPADVEEAFRWAVGSFLPPGSMPG